MALERGVVGRKICYKQITCRSIDVKYMPFRFVIYFNRYPHCFNFYFSILPWVRWNSLKQVSYTARIHTSTVCSLADYRWFLQCSHVLIYTSKFIFTYPRNIHTCWIDIYLTIISHLFNHHCYHYLSQGIHCIFFLQYLCFRLIFL